MFAAKVLCLRGLWLNFWPCNCRQKPIRTACFSPDGSLLAVAADDLVTLWNPATNGLVTVLYAPAPQVCIECNCCRIVQV